MGVGLVVARGRSAGALLVAAALTLLLAASAVCAAVLYAQSVTQAGLSQLLSSTPAGQRAVVVSADADATDGPLPLLDASQVLPGAGRVEVSSTVLSDAVVVSAAGSRGSSTQLLAGPDLSALVRVADGVGLPEAVAGDAVPVAVPMASAARLGVEVGAPVQLGRGEDAVAGEVVALVEPLDSGAPAWVGLGGQLATGTDEDGDAALGPLLVSELPAALAGGATARSVAVPDLSGVRVEQVPGLLGRVRALQDGAGVPDGAQVETGLEQVLAEVGRPLLVARSSVYLPAVLVVLSAGAALVLAARLVASSRSREGWLLRARGFSGRQLLGVAGREAVVVALPAAVLAPVLAAGALGLLSRWGPLAAAGVSGLGVAPASAWWVSGAVAAAGAVALVAVGGRRPGEVESTGRSGVAAAGVDVVVVVFAAGACWQLLRYGGPLAADAQGRLSVDPVLVAAPALVLLAGALLALRLLPWASRRLEVLAAGSRGLAGALGAWQVGRRPARQAGPALLVVLAVSVGALSTTYAASWDTSQGDQADLTAGADLRVDADEAAQQGAGAPGAYAQTPGVGAVMAVATQRVTVEGQVASLTSWDAGRAPQVVALRGDQVLAGEDLTGLGKVLVAARPPAPVVELPERSESLVLGVRARAEAGAGGAPAPEQLAVAVVVRDDAGVLHRLDAGDVPTDGALQELTVALDVQDRAVSGAGLLAVEVGVDTPAPQGVSGAGDTPLVDLEVAASAVTASDAGEGVVLLDPPAGWRASTPTGPVLPPSLEELAPGDGGAGGGALVSLRARTGALPGQVVLTLRPVEAGDDGAGELDLISPRTELSVPVLATPDLPGPGTTTSGGSSDGGGVGVQVSLAGRPVVLEPVGALAAVPGQGPADRSGSAIQAGPGYVADLPGLSLAVYEATGQVLEADSWWLGTTPGEHGAAATALASGPLGPVTADRLALAQDLRTDPLGVGVVTALLLALVGAALFAAVGVGVTAVVAVRERRGEFALLRAVGTSTRQLRAALAVEQLLLLGTGVVLGALLGVGVARVLVPRLVLDATGGAPVPAVQVTLPWAELAGLTGAVALALGLFVVLVTRALARSAVAATLRFGGP